MSQFITTSPLLNMRPVGTAAERSLPRLEAILQREFKGRISLRLAEPVARRDGAGIDWYVDDDDPLTQLVGLPDELSAYYRNRLKAEIATISAAAADYEIRNDPAAKATAAALRNAICYPGDDNVWVQGDAPSGKATIVLTAWGYEPQSSQLTGSHIIHKRERIFPDSAQVLIDQNHAAEEPGPTKTAASPQRKNWTGVLTNVLWGLAVVLPFFYRHHAFCLAVNREGHARARRHIAEAALLPDLLELFFLQSPLLFNLHHLLADFLAGFQVFLALQAGCFCLG